MLEFFNFFNVVFKHKQNKMFCGNWIIHVIATLSKQK